ncbi:ATP-binding protein [uncultured Adlercreutzia sp.]|uniref:ATP-binding protein n=1 Tax=uncultured Adlercreutzia sp. TaxID=875803 RepID=UPI0025EAB27A|nr:AAA family ATPase [uncultured Adlercreutzia sp.]MCI9261672.1 ATP-binding protein [Eggerthellaceae bacterium]
MFERKAYQALLQWRKNCDKTALLVTGARQIGKSFLVERLGRETFDSLVTINFLENDEAKQALSQAHNPTDLIARLSFFAENKLVPGKTLVFFDEIQELPDILTMAKFLVQDGRFAYAFSGSMLGTELKKVRSYPVGFVSEIRMYPMDFEEFCWANDVSSEALGTVAECCRNKKPVPDYIHESLLAYFRTYVVVGGMPAAVQVFVDSQDFSRVRETQAGLVVNYVHDVTKYAGAMAPEVRAIFEQLPLQLDAKSMRFKLNSLGEGARYDKYKLDFYWLVSAGVALKCDVVRDPKSPLMATEVASSFKLYESDTGMLVSRYPSSVAREVFLDDRKANYGHLFENVFAQQLAALGCDLFYYMNRKRGEVDFLVEDGLGGVIPLEIKSGWSPKAHAALSDLLSRPDYQGRTGYVLSRLNVEQAGQVVYLPWYAASCLAAALGLEAPYAADETTFKVTLPPV